MLPPVRLSAMYSTHGNRLRIKWEWEIQVATQLHSAFGKGEYQLQIGPHAALILLYWKPFLITLKSTPAGGEMPFPHPGSSGNSVYRVIRICEVRAKVQKKRATPMEMVYPADAWLRQAQSIYQHGYIGIEHCSWSGWWEVWTMRNNNLNTYSFLRFRLK